MEYRIFSLPPLKQEGASVMTLPLHGYRAGDILSLRVSTHKRWWQFWKPQTKLFSYEVADVQDSSNIEIRPLGARQLRKTRPNRRMWCGDDKRV